MSQPTPSEADPQLARDVARHLERLRVRRRLIRWLLLLALVALAALFLRFGDGFGLGGAGKGPGEGAHEVQPLTGSAGPRRCAVRVTASGITVDGKPMLRDQAVAACQATTGADVVITGDAREGDWKDLKSALDTAGVTDINVRQPRAGSAAN